MDHNINLLELNMQENTWIPPEIEEEELAYSVRNDVNALQSTEYLFIFRTDPYIDSIYIVYDPDRKPVYIRRFAIHEGYTWDRDSEVFFHEHCIKSQNCGYPGGQIERIYEKYKELRPEWHIQRYWTKSLRLLDHVYNCMKENTAKEMLYKAGLDELAAHIDEIDELNLVARKPSDIYDGLTMKVLRSVNCADGAALVSRAENRIFIKELNQKFPDLFEGKLNDAQCRYLATLISGDLTVGEAGRLFRSRKPDLAFIRSRSTYYVFMAMERNNMRFSELRKIFSSMDPIYENYFKSVNDPEDNRALKQLEYYLILHREEYDRQIRRANRKRDYDWQERGKKYILRFPQTINDFCRESIYMQNCLMTYVEAMIKNDTTILFMRRADDVNKPFITVEVYHGELMQAYRRFNVDCTPEEAAWIRDYCKRHGIKTGKFKFNAAVDELF